MESFMLMCNYQYDKLNLTRGTIITVEAFYNETTNKRRKFHFY